VENEEDFYFDYETKEEDGIEYTYINNFEILTEIPDDFIADLETLCVENAIEENYSFSYGEEDEEKEEEE
jgi:hypothetical protein